MGKTSPDSSHENAGWKQQLAAALVGGRHAHTIDHQEVLNPQGKGKNQDIMTPQEIHTELHAHRAFLMQAMQTYVPLEEAVPGFPERENVLGCEVLARVGVEGSVLRPGSFYPLFKNASFRDAVKQNSIQVSARVSHVLMRHGIKRPMVSFNGQTQDLTDALPAQISAACNEADTHPSGLVFELLEHSSPEPLENKVDTLHDMHDMGLRIAIDDMKSPDCCRRLQMKGNTTLEQFSTLRSLEVPVHEIKVPGEVMCGLHSHLTQQASLRWLVTFAAENKVPVVVLEGGPAGVDVDDIHTAKQIIASVKKKPKIQFIFEGSVLSRPKKKAPVA